eukprot:g64622.t1
MTESKNPWGKEWRSKPGTTVFFACGSSMTEEQLSYELNQCDGFVERFFRRDKNDRIIAFAAFRTPELADAAIETLRNFHIFGSIALKPLELNKQRNGQAKADPALKGAPRPGTFFQAKETPKPVPREPLAHLKSWPSDSSYSHTNPEKSSQPQQPRAPASKEQSPAAASISYNPYALQQPAPSSQAASYAAQQPVPTQLQQYPPAPPSLPQYQDRAAGWQQEQQQQQPVVAHYQHMPAVRPSAPSSLLWPAPSPAYNPYPSMPYHPSPAAYNPYATTNPYLQQPAPPQAMAYLTSSSSNPASAANPYQPAGEQTNEHAHHTLCIQDPGSLIVEDWARRLPGFKEIRQTGSQLELWVRFGSIAEANFALSDFWQQQTSEGLMRAKASFAVKRPPKNMAAQQPGQTTLFLSLGKLVTPHELDDLMVSKFEGFLASNYKKDKRGQWVAFARFDQDQQAATALNFLVGYKEMWGTFSKTHLDVDRLQRLKDNIRQDQEELYSPRNSHKRRRSADERPPSPDRKPPKTSNKTANGLQHSGKARGSDGRPRQTDHRSINFRSTLHNVLQQQKLGTPVYEYRELQLPVRPYNKEFQCTITLLNAPHYCAQGVGLTKKIASERAAQFFLDRVIPTIKRMGPEGKGLDREVETDFDQRETEGRHRDKRKSDGRRETKGRQHEQGEAEGKSRSQGEEGKIRSQGETEGRHRSQRETEGRPHDNRGTEGRQYSSKIPSVFERAPDESHAPGRTFHHPEQGIPPTFEWDERQGKDDNEHSDRRNWGLGTRPGARGHHTDRNAQYSSRQTLEGDSDDDERLMEEDLSWREAIKAQSSWEDTDEEHEHRFQNRQYQHNFRGREQEHGFRGRGYQHGFRGFDRGRAFLVWFCRLPLIGRFRLPCLSLLVRYTKESWDPLAAWPATRLRIFLALRFEGYKGRALMANRKNTGSYMKQGVKCLVSLGGQEKPRNS